MSIAVELAADPLAVFVEEVEQSLAKLKKRMVENPNPAGSRALAFAIAAGFPPQMAYTVPDTAAYLGIDEQTLRRERRAGRIKFILPVGSTKGYRVTVDEVDRWLNEN